MQLLCVCLLVSPSLFVSVDLHLESVVSIPHCTDDCAHNNLNTHGHTQILELFRFLGEGTLEGGGTLRCSINSNGNTIHYTTLHYSLQQ